MEVQYPSLSDPAVAEPKGAPAGGSGLTMLKEEREGFKKRKYHNRVPWPAGFKGNYIL